MDSKREEFEKWAREHFVCSDHSFNRAYAEGYYNTVSSNTFHGRRPAEYAAVSMLWDTWQAALASLQPAQPAAFFQRMNKGGSGEFIAVNWNIPPCDIPDSGTLYASPLPQSSRVQIRNETLMQALKGETELVEPVHITKALRAGRQARVVLSGGTGPLACVMLVNIQLTPWIHTEDTAKSFADGYNRALDQLRAALLEVVSPGSSNGDAIRSSGAGDAEDVRRYRQLLDDAISTRTPAAIDKDEVVLVVPVAWGDDWKERTNAWLDAAIAQKETDRA